MDVYISHFAKADMFCDGRRCQPRQQRQWHEKGPVFFFPVSAFASRAGFVRQSSVSVSSRSTELAKGPIECAHGAQHSGRFVRSY